MRLFKKQFLVAGILSGMLSGSLVLWGCNKSPTSTDTPNNDSLGVKWTMRTSGTMKILRSVIWAGNQLVAVGDSGTILTSPNGITWSVRSSGTTNDLYSVTWTGAQLVTVGGNSKGSAILTSPDGVAWTSRTSGNPLSVLQAVTWTGTQFVAVGGQNTFTSPNGITWTQHYIGLGAMLSVTWTGNQLVAVGYNGNITTSPDGIIWTKQNSGLGTTDQLYSVIWTGSQLICVGSDGISSSVILTSPDGVTWTSHNLTNNMKGLSSVAWTGTSTSSGTGQLVAVGGSISLPSNSAILTSPDGVTWTLRNSVTTNVLNSVTWTGSQLVAVGGPSYNSSGLVTSNSTILTSP